ncbi:MAG TPA: serine protease, partial [Myxococcaceae bacterium]|nr:serine protease [Myxococcaceae bacterium]
MNGLPWLALCAAPLLAAAPLPHPAAPVPAPPSPYCAGDYADDFSVMSPAAREFESHPQQPYTFCVRTSAVYECPSYGTDGNLRRTRRKAMAHGTGFAYRQQNGDTLLLTNQHVAEWPPVTDEDHPVDDVPAGCKRVSDFLRIVDNEADAYEPDDIPLTKVVADPQLDIAILKTRAPLAVMPWKIGRSAGLRERNVVDVRGFPLGAFKATNVGKVVSAYDHDEYKDWDHDDFVVDALLSPGNSGSPVFALSCKTGELELVGVYHAGYSRGSALNVVVGIDQIRDLMSSLRRAPRQHVDATLDAATRAQLVDQVHGAVEPFFPFGALPAAVRVRSDGALIFEVFSKDFPFKPHPVLAVEDLPSGPEAFGEPGRVWLGNGRGLKPWARSDADGDTQALVARIIDALRRDALTAFAYRAAHQGADSSREHFDQMSQLERALRRATQAHQDLSQ